MSEHVCPLCGNEKFCEKVSGDRNGYIGFFCETFKSHFFLADDIINLRNDDKTKNKLLDLVVEQIVHRPQPGIKGEKWHFFYNPQYKIKDDDPSWHINLADRLTTYPDNTLEVVNRGLLNLSYYYPHYGDIFEITQENKRMIFEHDKNNSIGMHGVVDFFVEMGYLKKARIGTNNYTLTANAWEKIDELHKSEITLKQAFIAMQFGDKTKEIREAFRTAIQESGFEARLIDEKEHNNQIVPEILYEIKQSRFMVVDITYPNYGAYYEAGYGQALGKEVIICCRKEEFDSLDKKPHFDIAQKSMIVWKDKDDLVERLKKRIVATVK